jgi:hypothetical protein
MGSLAGNTAACLGSIERVPADPLALYGDPVAVKTGKSWLLGHQLSHGGIGTLLGDAAQASWGALEPLFKDTCVDRQPRGRDNVWAHDVPIEIN